MLRKMSLISINILAGLGSWLAIQVVDDSVAIKWNRKINLIIISSKDRKKILNTIKNN